MPDAIKIGGKLQPSVAESVVGGLIDAIEHIGYGQPPAKIAFTLFQ